MKALKTYDGLRLERTWDEWEVFSDKFDIVNCGAVSEKVRYAVGEELE